MDHLEIAVYGKGGIGKSTVSANLTAAVAKRGLKVLQIGCDPKHDSTRLLMAGESIPTVLDVLKAKGKDMAAPEDILKAGANGVGCIEAGGPTPGVGCAGRGIISAFEFLDQYKLRERYDRVIYDVLGDVVCGGFAVPVRREYADTVFLVTSGEYMALYAANNILRGIRNFDGDTHARVAGIIYNERRLEDEDGRVSRFASAVGLPIIAKVPRSEAFARAEQSNCTVMELPDASAEQQVFAKVADLIVDGVPQYKARPLSDEELEHTVLGTDYHEPQKSKVKDVQGSEAEDVDSGAERAWNRSGNVNRLPLYGCAFNGAATAAVHLEDAIVIAHGPSACAFYTLQTITSPGRKNLFNRGVLTSGAISPNFVSTDIGHGEAVFGGMDLLRGAVQEALAKKPGAVIVISTCVSGIIGDDLTAVEEMSTPKIPVIAVKADGDIAGDYMKGIQMILETLVDRLAEPVKADEQEPYTVNIIGETGIATNGDSNFQVMERLLGAMGIRVNCRFLGGTTVEALRRLKKAPLNILASDTGDAHLLKQFLIEKHGCQFLEAPMPVGDRGTAEWVRAVAQFFGREKEAEELLVQEHEAHEQAVARLRRRLKGRKAVLSTINASIDWLLETADAAGLSFEYIGVFNYLRTPLVVTANPEKYPMMEETMDIGRVQGMIQKTHPDIILSAYTATVEDEHAITDSIPMVPDLGVMSGVKLLERWANLLDRKRKGAWERDKTLFEKYFT